MRSPQPDLPAPSVARVAALLGGLVALTVIGASAVAVALPAMGEDLGLPVADRAWVIAGFSLTFSVSTAIFGRLGDIAGLRLPMRIGIVLFALGSVIGAAAPGFATIVIGRLIQGAGAGAVPVLAMGIVAARFSPEARGRVLGGLTAMVAIVSGSGPLIGGLLTDAISWRAVFALPVIALALGEPVARLAPAQSRGTGRVDVVGAVLVAATVSGFTLLIQAPATRPGALVVGLGIGGLVVGGLGLITHVRRTPHGLIPHSVIANSQIILWSLAAASLMAAYLAAMFAIPQILTAAGGWTPLRIGLALLPAAATGAVCSRLVGAHGARLGTHRVAAVLTAASALGMTVIALGAPRAPVMVVGMAFVASAFAGGQVALLDAISGAADPAIRGVSIGVFNVMFFLGGAIGAAAAGGIGDAVSLPVAMGALAVLPALGVVAALSSGGPPPSASTEPGAVPSA